MTSAFHIVAFITLTVLIVLRLTSGDVSAGEMGVAVIGYCIVSAMRYDRFSRKDRP